MFQRGKITIYQCPPAYSMGTCRTTKSTDLNYMKGKKKLDVLWEMNYPE